MTREPIVTVLDAEIVIGLVAPLGTGLDQVCKILEDRLSQFNYETNIIKLSELIRSVDNLETELNESPEQNRLKSYMDAGDEIRKKFERGDYLALLAMMKIAKSRSLGEDKQPEPLRRRAHILRSLKHPEEVLALREVYGPGFFLIGVNAPRDSRLNYLTKDKGISGGVAQDLLMRDEHDELDPSDFGQQTREAFELADAFIATNQPNYKRQLWRLLDLLFGHPYITPTADEYAMFLAYAAALRSADLSRQVGAVIRSSDGEIIAAGANDVPKFEGGLYWPNDLVDDNDSKPDPTVGQDQRDYVRGFDANARRRNTMIVNAALKERGEELINEEKLYEKDPDGKLLANGKKILEGVGVTDITEYSRAVHAEMEALMAAARIGVSPRHGTIFCTTFPCHNCAKHIVAAGIQRVVYVEPYPKSQALNLHPDSIDLVSPGGKQQGKVRFEPFVGVGPRRFLDLFSMGLSSGRPIKRHSGGKTVKFERSAASLRAPMVPIPYLQREQAAITLLSTSPDLMENGDADENQTQD